MAIFGSIRDASLIRHLNRELLHDIITQQCALYKIKIAETKVNIYGETSGARYYHDPVLLNCLIDRGEMDQPTNDFGVDYSREVEFKFFRDDLVSSQTVPEVGDIIMYYEDYFEVDTVIENQLFAGKDPKFPYNTNPLNPGLEEFGMDVSIICKTHYTSADRVQITKERI
tara:strand:+ start:891 stop:1400 length:510 start_codon:yes stop_codon:yes gene_type:complete